MKLTLKHFEKFKKWSKEYQEKLGLDDWEIAYKFEFLENNRAETAVDLEASKASIFLSSDWRDSVVPYSDAGLKKTALHEMLHVFLAELTELARYRYVSFREIETANHRVVQKLVKIL